MSWLDRFKAKRATPDLSSAFEKLRLLIEDDDLQLRVLGPKDYSDFKAMPALERTKNGEGAFGTTFTNPIPVNGPIGSIAYLSHLQTSNGSRVFFHRIATIGSVDIYEYVSFDASVWGLMFLNLYHSRKSRVIPDGFQRAAGVVQFSGSNHYWREFPANFQQQKLQMPADIRLAYIPTKAYEEATRGRDFRRPELHEQLVHAVIVNGKQE